MSSLLIRLWIAISIRRRIQLIMIAILGVASSFAEIVTIGTVLPFLFLLTTPEKFLEQPFLIPLINYFEITDSYKLLALSAVIFVSAAIISGLMRFGLLWAQTRVGYAIGQDVSTAIYRKTLYQPYLIHSTRNSSEVISGILDKANAIVGRTVLPFMTIASSTLMLGSTIIVLGIIYLEVAISAFLGFGGLYVLVIFSIRKHLAKNGLRISIEQSKVLKNLHEGLGGIRDILIDGTQEVFCRSYREADIPLRKSAANIQIIGAGPRFCMETLGIVLIVLLAYFLATNDGGLVSAIPVLGALALAAQRMLPILQQAYGSWATMIGGQASLKDALDLLSQPLPSQANLPPPAPLNFKNEIRLSELSFRYSALGPMILSDINLVIQRGAKVGFIGPTGSGKSTLIDILMGLLQPTSGALLIDGFRVSNEETRSWQAHIAHVPQSIFLADLSIAENIAFGVPRDNIDFIRVQAAASKAQLAQTIETWEYKYETVVGERGIRLSGGQRQRIGIARALYKKADVIFLDEATSALDNDTEASVMDAIYALDSNITVLIIAHRLTTLKNCTEIVRLESGKISAKGTYSEMVEIP